MTATNLLVTTGENLTLSLLLLTVFRYITNSFISFLYWLTITYMFVKSSACRWVIAALETPICWSIRLNCWSSLYFSTLVFPTLAWAPRRVAILISIFQLLYLRLPATLIWMCTSPVLATFRYPQLPVATFVSLDFMGRLPFYYWTYVLSILYTIVCFIYFFISSS